MTKVEQKPIDKSKWPAGPWMSEPDRVQWRTASGLHALIRRTGMGHLCGYVAVPPGHPAHGKTDHDYLDVDVHGGITYGAACDGEVCHVPPPGEPDDVWWLGFDAAHSGDLSPSNLQYRDARGSYGELYRDVPYVRAECERLAEQLAAMVREAGR